MVLPSDPSVKLIAAVKSKRRSALRGRLFAAAACGTLSFENSGSFPPPRASRMVNRLD